MQARSPHRGARVAATDEHLQVSNRQRLTLDSRVGSPGEEVTNRVPSPVRSRKAFLRPPNGLTLTGANRDAMK